MFGRDAYKYKEGKVKIRWKKERKAPDCSGRCYQVQNLYIREKKDIKKVQKQRVLELVGHWTPGFQPHLLGTDCMLRELE